MGTTITFIVILVVLGLVLFSSAVKVLQEYERGVVFRLGRIAGVRGPGLILLIPFVVAAFGLPFWFPQSGGQAGEFN